MDVRLLAPDVATLLDVAELAMLPRSALDTSVGGGKMAATYRVTVSCAGISPEEAAAGIPAILEEDKGVRALSTRSRHWRCKVWSGKKWTDR